MEVEGTYTAPAAVQPPIGSPPNHQPSALNGDFNGSSSLLNGSEAFSPTGAVNGNSFNLAPGIERSNAGANAAGSSHSSATAITPNKNAVVVDYSQDFPELPPAAVKNVAHNPSGAWAKPMTNARAVKPNNVTQVFHLPAEERSIKNFNRQLGNTSEEQQKCNTIALATETTIELCEAKDHTLTILITGKRAKVEEARARIVRDLQTQASREIPIPKEHHRVLIGKEGSNLRQLEADTDCRIIVPGRDAPSDVIKVIGPREGIEKAVHQIELISHEQSKLAQEHLMIPRIFYPWIRGPFNETLDRLLAETGAKINIPPPSAKSEVIVVTGEKEGVYKAASVIRRIFEEQQALVKSVTCKVARAQHRYVIGPQRCNLSDVLKQTGVSVEVPSEEEDSDTITLRGDPAKLGDALSLVYAKASSVITAEINCPAWLHKFIIGPKGATLQQIVPNKNKVQVDFEDGGTIFLEGAPEEVKIAQEALNSAVNRLKTEMATETIKVHPSYHRHVIGKGGSLITKIKNETGVQITIPNESTNSDEIKVEGKKDGVTKAVADISELVKRMENEKSKDMVIEQRLHKQIIGSKGESISKLREQYPSVVFSFPDAGRKSDIVSLRGDKNEVDKVFKQLTTIVKDLESNFQMSVPIFKDFHKHIIGKGGANVRKIREETTTRIDLPGEGSGEDKILVTGKKANVEKAVAQLTQIQNELASIVTLDLTIPAKIHSRLLGGGRRLVQDIQDECGGVQIRFPPEKSNSDKVTIRGPKDDAARAQKLLMDLANDRELSSFEDSVTAKAEFHRFLIGKGGSKIKKVRESCPDVRILFPRESDKDQETIHLIGRKEEVAQIKKHLEELILHLNEIVEVTTDVPAKWHKHFVARGANVLREIQDQNGGVSISFPRQNAQDTKVSIKGSKDCVEGAKQRIAEIVADLEAQITIKADIPAEYHRTLLGNRGQKVQDICAKYNVQIKFPDRETREAGGNHEEASGDGPSVLNTVSISGRLENCESARTALQACIPITEVAEVPFEFHGNLIGRSGETVRALMQNYDVSISIPPADQQLNEIKISGQAESVKDAIAEIGRRVDEFKLGAKDRELRMFQLTVQVPPEYHQRLIGPRGQKINQMRAKHDVQISIPKQAEGEEPNENVVITGYEENAHKCKAEIEEMVNELKNLFVQEITLDARIHPRLIGAKGRSIRKVMDDYHVDIRFPRSTDPDPNLVTVTGKDEDSVYNCIDHLRELEEEFSQDIGGGSYMSHRTEEPEVAQKQAPLQMVNAPWQVPDTNNMSDFPAMGAGAVGAPSGANGVWGGQRRF